MKRSLKWFLWRNVCFCAFKSPSLLAFTTKYLASLCENFKSCISTLQQETKSICCKEATSEMSETLRPSLQTQTYAELQLVEKTRTEFNQLAMCIRVQPGPSKTTHIRDHKKALNRAQSSPKAQQFPQAAAFVSVYICLSFAFQV